MRMMSNLTSLLNKYEFTPCKDLIDTGEYSDNVARTSEQKERKRLYDLEYQKNLTPEKKQLKYEYKKEWWLRNKAKSKMYKINQRKVWSCGMLSNYSEKVVQSELYVAHEILPKLGFVEILVTRPYHSRFFVDIIAKDSEGRECAIDVKLTPVTDIKPSKKILAKHLGMRFFVAHTSPGLTECYLNELPDMKVHSSAVKQIKAMIKGESK